MSHLERIAPSLSDPFKSIYDSIRYTAPEAFFLRWQDLQSVLTAHAGPMSDLDLITRKRLRNVFAAVDETAGLTAEEISQIIVKKD